MSAEKTLIAKPRHENASQSRPLYARRDRKNATWGLGPKIIALRPHKSGNPNADGAGPVTIAVTEYDHFISFSVENYQGQSFFVQYRRDQVWKDENGVWQVEEGCRPFYSSPSSQAAGQQPEVNLSPAFCLAFVKN